MNEELFEKYCLGTLTAVETNELKSTLVRSGPARDELARYLQERSILVHLTARMARSVRRPSTRSRRPENRLPLIAAAVAAAAVVVFALTAALSGPSPAPVAAKPAPTVIEERIVTESKPPPPPPERPRETKNEVVVREPAPFVVPPPAPPPAPKPAPTVAAVATVERASGTTGLTAGQPILPGQRIEIGGGKSAAILALADGTRIEIGPRAVLRDFDAAQGWQVFIERGSVTADVAKQPADRPMQFVTPHGRATVLGTRLRLDVAAATRLEVREGKVRLARADGRSVEVPAGLYAATADLVARSLAREFGREDFESMPTWAGRWDATWGGGAIWSLGSGPSGKALQFERPAKGSSVGALFFTVPADASFELSALMKCPRLAGRSWVEFGYRLGRHAAKDFDVDPTSWSLVQRFDSSSAAPNAWTRCAARVATGRFTEITVAIKVGSRDGAVPPALLDSIRLME